jgi:hypothetical protein
LLTLPTANRQASSPRDTSSGIKSEPQEQLQESGVTGAAFDQPLPKLMRGPHGDRTDLQSRAIQTVRMLAEALFLSIVQMIDVALNRMIDSGVACYGRNQHAAESPARPGAAANPPETVASDVERFPQRLARSGVHGHDGFIAPKSTPSRPDTAVHSGVRTIPYGASPNGARGAGQR